MTVREVARLADWLKANGHTDSQIIECIKHIAYGSQKKKPATIPDKK